jgi:hypothetical protein
MPRPVRPPDDQPERRRAARAGLATAPAGWRLSAHFGAVGGVTAGYAARRARHPPSATLIAAGRRAGVIRILSGAAMTKTLAHAPGGLPDSLLACSAARATKRWS